MTCFLPFNFCFCNKSFKSCSIFICELQFRILFWKEFSFNLSVHFQSMLSYVFCRPVSNIFNVLSLCNISLSYSVLKCNSCKCLQRSRFSSFRPSYLIFFKILVLIIEYVLTFLYTILF